MTGGISATRHPRPLHWICFSLPAPEQGKPAPPSVNLISWMMSQSCLWGQGLRGGQRNEFIAVCPVTPLPHSLAAELGWPCLS